MSRERLDEILEQLRIYSDAYDPDGGDVNPFQDVICLLPEYDARATAEQGFPEEADVYVLTDGTVLEHDGRRWYAHTRGFEGEAVWGTYYPDPYNPNEAQP